MKINYFEIISRYLEHCPVDVKGLIKTLGIDVEFSNLGDDISGVIERRNNGSYLITVNAGDSESRQRFTMAHELGHYIYHREKMGDCIEDNRMYRSTYGSKHYNNNISQKEETQANQFAANLLMPSDLIVQLKNENFSDEEIAKKLCVSQKALKIRLESLSL